MVHERQGDRFFRHCGGGDRGPHHLRDLWLTLSCKRNLFFFFTPFALFGINQELKYRVTLPAAGYLLRCHFNDYLGGIAFSAYVNLVLWFSPYWKYRLHRAWHFVLLAAGCSLFWEGIAPLFLRDSTPDWLDAAAYLLGAMTYYALNRRELSRPVLRRREALPYAGEPV